ncbi:dihydrofolate reductase [Burkholderiales bacterium]|nr:dihydrofolate reductase [Burkholderiales bacterium]
MSDRPASPTGQPPAGAPVPELAIVAAVASNGVIGVAGGLPWRLPDDLRRFRALTRGHAVIMGRRTWESLRGPLPDRQNIVVTSRADRASAGAEVVATLAEALARVAMPPPAFCIGGAELYREALPRARALHLTEIGRPFDGDVSFPAFARDEWREVARESHVASDGLRYAFVDYVRVRGA